MTYQAGSINSPTPALQAMNEIDGVIVAHPAWEFVEQVVSGAKTARVYKNKSLVSGLPNDFFVVVWRDTDAGQVYFSLCESWDAGTKKLVRYAPAPALVSGSGSYQIITADGTVGPTGQNFDSTHVLAATPFEPTMISTLFPYFLSVSNHRICYAHRNQGWVYAGAYESLGGYYDPFPIVLLSNGHVGYGTALGWNRTDGQYWKCMDRWDISAGQQLGYPSSVSVALPYWCGSFTRQWRTTVQAASGWSVRPYLVSILNPRHGGIGMAYWNYRDVLSRRWFASRVGLNQGHFSLGATNSDCRGLLRDVLQCDPMDGYPQNGDGMMFEGVDHACMCERQQSRPGEHLWVSKAA